MKVLDKIDDKIKHFENRAPVELPTYRQMFINCLASSRAESPQEAIYSYELINLFKKTIPDANASAFALTISDLDYSLLIKRCSENQLGWATYYQAQMLMKLQESQSLNKNVENKLEVKS